jgi:TonB family protein
MKRIFFTIVMMGFCVASLYAQGNTKEEVPGVDKPFPPIAETSVREPYEKVDMMPEYMGGISALKNYLIANIRYPAKARKKNIQGKVVVKFVIDEDGNVVNSQIIKSVDKTLDEEALRVIKSMSKWKPGMLNGKPVKVYYTLPVSFRITK